MLNNFGSASGIGALGISGQAFIIQLITFLIVFWVLKRFAFKPILRVLDQRRESIENGVKLGEEMKAKSSELEEKITSELKKARTEADEILTLANVRSREIIQAAESEAKAKSVNILSEADEKIKQNTQQARKHLERDLVGLISEVTEVIIEEKINPIKDAELISKALKETRV